MSESNNRVTIIQNIGDEMGRFKRALLAIAAHDNDSGDVSPTQLMLLRMIYCYQPLSHSDLARRMSMTPGAVSQLLEGLETAGFIVKTLNQADRRMSYVSVSRSGKRRMDEYRTGRNQLLAAALQDVPDSDLQTYLRVQRSATDWLEQHPIKPLRRKT